jgi:hypothetical protein
VTTQRLILKHGFIERNIDELQLWAINLQQSLQGTGDDANTLPAIADPLHFRKAIQDAIGQMSQPNVTDIGEVQRSR